MSGTPEAARLWLKYEQYRRDEITKLRYLRNVGYMFNHACFYVHSPKPVPSEKENVCSAQSCYTYERKNSMTSYANGLWFREICANISLIVVIT